MTVIAMRVTTWAAFMVLLAEPLMVRVALWLPDGYWNLTGALIAVAVYAVAVWLLIGRIAARAVSP